MSIIAPRTPRFAARGVSALLLFGCLSCISDSPSVKSDTRDTAETFFVETTPDAADTVDTTPEATAEIIDETGVIDVVPEVVAETCTVPEDCTSPPPDCFTWVCPQGMCEAAPASGGSCDDNNLCTGPGICAGGQCQPGRALTCDGATACGRPTCDPLTGCGVEPIDDGFCEAGNATAWGTCDGVRMAPADICDGSVCVDQSTPGNIPVASSALEGDWFVAAMWVHSLMANIMGGVVTFDAGGKWGGVFRTNNDQFIVDDNLGRRGWCLDANNGLGLQLSINDFTGQMDANGRVFTASGAIASENMIGLRSEGFGVDTTGTYQAMYITANALGTGLRVAYAFMTFTNGCIDEDSAFVGDPTLEPVFFNAGGCMRAVGKLTALSMSLDDAGTEVSAGFIGALDASNELGVFVLEDGQTDLGLGMLTIVRLDDSARPLFTGPSRWVYSYQAPAGGNHIGYPGALYFNGVTLLNGTREGAIISGDRVDLDDFGRFLLTLRSSNERTTLSGYLSASLGFGFYYEVAVPEDWVSWNQVSETPKRSAWGFLVKRP